MLKVRKHFAVLDKITRQLILYDIISIILMNYNESAKKVNVCGISRQIYTDWVDYTRNTFLFL